ncbi:unnamed protein product, partial [marine sediment metagenome]
YPVTSFGDAIFNITNLVSENQWVVLVHVISDTTTRRKIGKKVKLVIAVARL